MALPTNPKIGDIITELQDLTLINQKAEMAGVVGAPTTSTSNNQDFVETIQDAKDIIATKTGQSNTLPLLVMANGIVTGKKWATGDVISSADSLNFTVSNNSTISSNYIQVVGLNFKPSLIFAFSNIPNADSLIYFSNGNLVNTRPLIKILNQSTSLTTGTGDIRSFLEDGIMAYVSNASFRMPIMKTENSNYTWLAFE